MKIAIEAQRIFRRQKHGMDFVALETIRELQKRNDGNEYYVIVAPGEDRCLEESPNLSIVELRCPTYPLWEQVALPYAIKQLGVDLLHCTSNTAPIWCPVPLVLTLHDIIYLDEARPQGLSSYQKMGWYYRQWNVPRIVNRCRAVMTVSEKERDRILRYFPQLSDRLTVVHNGYSRAFCPLPQAQVDAVTANYLEEKSYLFFLGNTDPRKNTRGVLQAFALYLERTDFPRKLVLTGLSQKQVTSLLKELHIEHCTPHIVCTGYIPGEDLPALYNGAFAFLFPSLQEGFGIPIIEAMACGTPTITSNQSAMPEVAGEGAILVDPTRPASIADALLRLEKDTTLRERQRTYGLQRATRFSWANTASHWVTTYKTVLNTPNTKEAGR